MSLLSVKDLSVSFGGVKAVDGVGFEVNEGEIYTIVGPNGAGKSTIFNLISRIYEPDSGRIRFDGEDITAIRPDAVALRGISRIFQNIELFEHSTVLDNLLVGQHSKRTANWLSNVLFLPATRREELRMRRRAEEVIDLLDLQAYRNSTIAGLPYGIRKMVSIARAISSGPRLVMLDEPASGLSVEETGDMAFWIEDMKRDLGITVLMVEHDMGLVNQVSDRVLAIADGRVLAEGTAEEVQRHPEVVAAYLGAEAAA